MSLRRSLYINAGLLAGVLGLVAILWLSPERQEPNLHPFTHINADTVSHIEIIVPLQQSALLQRQDGAWRALEPRDAELDVQRLQNVLTILNASAAPGYEAASLDLKEFGLEPPAATLRIDDHSFHFGTIEPLSRRRYVLHGNKLYLLTDNYYPLLSRGIGNLLQAHPRPIRQSNE